MSLSMADVTLSGFKEQNWTYIYLFHIYMRDHVAMSDYEDRAKNSTISQTDTQTHRHTHRVAS